jgi:hypothetical protein
MSKTKIILKSKNIEFCYNCGYRLEIIEFKRKMSNCIFLYCPNCKMKTEIEPEEEIVCEDIAHRNFYGSIIHTDITCKVCGNETLALIYVCSCKKIMHFGSLFCSYCRKKEIQKENLPNDLYMELVRNDCEEMNKYLEKKYSAILKLSNIIYKE